MRLDIKILTDWKVMVPSTIAIISLGWSIFNWIVARLTKAKIMGNEIKHLQKDIEKVENDSIDYIKENKKELRKIYLRLGKIEREIVKRATLCSERHKND